MAHRGEDLYEQHARQVFRYLFSITGEQDTAEELTQETFYQALKNLEPFGGQHAPGLAVRHRQAPVVQGAGAPEEDGSAGGGALSTLAASDDPVEETERREDRMALYRAMQRLDGDTREVIHLRLAGDFSFREIGDILEKSEVWARVRFYRGKEELAKLMGGGYGGKPVAIIWTAVWCGTCCPPIWRD